MAEVLGSAQPTTGRSAVEFMSLFIFGKYFFSLDSQSSEFLRVLGTKACLNLHRWCHMCWDNGDQYVGEATRGSTGKRFLVNYYLYTMPSAPF